MILPFFFIFFFKNRMMPLSLFVKAALKTRKLGPKLTLRLCPSCGSKEMSETVYHLVENINPKVPIRQYALSIPYPLRYWLASSKQLTGKVSKILARAVREFYCDPNKKKIRSEAITFIQRFGGALTANDYIFLQ